jgi:CheY-like chemotaxis protein
MTHACTLKEAYQLFNPRGGVLIVEDDGDISELLAQVIREEGFQVETAKDGEAALEHVLANEPRLIFVDLRMPKMDGWQFCDELRRRFPLLDAKVVLVSASSNLPHEAEHLHAEHFLQKPFHVDDVVRLTRHYCDCTALAV